MNRNVISIAALAATVLAAGCAGTGNAPGVSRDCAALKGLQLGQ